MLRVTLSLTLLMIVVGVSVTAQEPDYQYPFDGSIQNVTANPALTWSEGTFGYGMDRAGNANASIFFTGGKVYSYPKQMPTDQITVCFWYKATVEGVSLPQTQERYNILGAVDTNAVQASSNVYMPWSVFVSRSSASADEFCLKVATGSFPFLLCFETGASWNHITLVWDNSGTKTSIKGYVNGKRVVEQDGLTRNVALKPDMLAVANQDTLSLIDDLRIYNRLLSDAEITALGAGGGPNSVAENGTLRSMAFYPNPTADVITLNIPDDAVVNEIEVRDQMGRVVRREQASATISLSTLSNGPYSIYTLNNGQVVGVNTVLVLR